jgi:hypothetical protein
LLTLPASAVKVALLWPAGTVTLAGTESSGLLLAIATTALELVAEPRLTVQVAGTSLAIAEGEQDSAAGPMLGLLWRLSVKLCETPLSAAVTSAI